MGFSGFFLPGLDCRDGLFRRLVVLALHRPVHVGELHLSPEVHVHGRALHRRVREVLHRVSELQFGSGQLETRG